MTDDRSVFTVDFGAGRTALAAYVDSQDGLATAVRELGLTGPRPVVVVVGGASGMCDADVDRVRAVLDKALLPLIAARGAVVVDGGTDAGVMRMMGRARSGFPLVGVAARDTVVLPGTPPGSAEAAPAEPHHSHLLLVPGETWGRESPWLADAATLLAGGAPSVTVLVNGGLISFDDVTHSLRTGRPVLVLAGTGRTADRIADAARRLDRGDAAVNDIADSPLVHIAEVSEPDAVHDLLTTLVPARL